MLNEVINRLRGQVRIRAECAFPERVLNLCGAQDLSFWDLKWESPTAFTCRLSRRDWRILRQVGRNLDCTFSVLGLEGAPYFLLRFRHRQALVIGLVGCSLALFLGSFFIWDFQVEGNVNVPTERILRALEMNGVGLGTFGLSLDGEDIRNHVLLDVPELSWIAVNVSGCRASVPWYCPPPRRIMIQSAISSLLISKSQAAAARPPQVFRRNERRSACPRLRSGDSPWTNLPVGPCQ